jgi:diguanylate cyclase (GGDEF)-like protein
MVRSLEVLTGLTRELQRAPGFAELLELVVGSCARLLDTPRASIRLLDGSGTRLLAVCRAGSPLHMNPSEPFQVGEGLLGWIVEHSQPLLCDDAEADARFAPRPGMREPLRAFVGVPLVAGNTLLGVLSASHPDAGHFAADHQELLTLLAGIAAPHIEIARRDLAARDPLTGLFNHAHFQKTIEYEIERSVLYALPFTLVLVDIDSFRAVNETRGHHLGDALLKAVADILVGRRKVDDKSFRLRNQDTVARYGADEFALMLPHTPKDGGEAKADRLRDFVARHDFADLDLASQSVSAGVAAVPDDAYDRAGIVAAAEHALRAAKRTGKNRTIAYGRAVAAAGALESAFDVDIEKLIALEAAIEKGEIGYVYQPIVEAVTAKIVAYEALCRPTNACFPGPAALFETAERAGRVLDLGRVCRQKSTAALDRLPDGCSLFLNIHPRELDETTLLRDEVLTRSAHRVVLEITETAAIEDYERAREVIGRLRERGFRVALDDLGSGYAGLNALAQLQPDFVKLDMALVRRIHSKGSTRRLVTHILDFCAGEQIPVVSEGVETAEEHAIIRELGCPLVQGNFIAPPAAL